MQATSIRLSTLVQVVVMGLSAIIISFAYEWKLTLLIFAFIPLLLFAGAMYTTINTSFAAKEKETLIKAASVSSYVVVVAFVTFFSHFESTLHLCCTMYPRSSQTFYVTKSRHNVTDVSS